MQEICVSHTVLSVEAKFVTTQEGLWTQTVKNLIM